MDHIRRWEATDTDPRTRTQEETNMLQVIDDYRMAPCWRSARHVDYARVSIRPSIMDLISFAASFTCYPI